LYQTEIKPSITGMFSSSGALRRCWSMRRAPASSAQKRSMPMTSAKDSPTADHKE